VAALPGEVRVRELRIVPGVYAVFGELPPGCRFCMMGGKVVVFITGLCDEKCFYCPVSRERLGRDVFYADEEPVSSIEDLLDEVDAIGAEGASITGGDPLIVPDRVEKLVKLLKSHYGGDFHIHLYTSGLYATTDVLRSLELAGLDEIRFHIVDERLGLNRIERALSVLKRTVVDVEIPMLPDRVEWTKNLILKLEKLGVSFINLNELEVSPTNIRALAIRGYRISAGKPVVKGSEEAALEIVEWAKRQGLNISVHYCPAAYKDRVQLRARMLRKAVRIAKPYQRITVDGMLEQRVLPADSAEGRRIVGEGLGEAIGGLVATSSRLRVRGDVVRVYPTLSKGKYSLPLEREGVS
jgi:hypothetical protein